MKHHHILPILWSASCLAMLSACVDYSDATHEVAARVVVTPPQEFEGKASLEGRTVAMQLGGQTLTARTDGQGVATFGRLVPDVYDISTSWEMTADEYRAATGDNQVVSGCVVSGSLNQYLVKEEQTIVLETHLSINRDILIGKVYYAGSKDVNNRTYMAGKYVELYNQSEDSVDVAGLYLGLVEAEGTQAYTLENLQAEHADSVLLKQVFRIPADKPCLVKPGGTVLIVNSATDHTPNNLMESDLTDADFEAKDATGKTTNNPATPALELVYTMYPAVSNMNLVQSGPCGVVIFRTDDDVTQWPRTYAYGKTSGNQWLLLDKRLVTDGIEILRLKPTGIDIATKRLYDDIDAGYTNIAATSGWNGEVVYRKTARRTDSGQLILTDTNNSSNDMKTSATIKPRQYDESDSATNNE